MPNNKVYLVYKSIGPSSFACVNHLRHSLGAEKAGHIGTLDPFAEGLLPIFVDRATRLIPYLPEGDKTYRALIMLGAATSTLDSNGEISNCKDLSFQEFYGLVRDNASVIRNRLNELIGENEQEIPIYSAKKVRGRKMYEYARAKQELSKQYKTIKVTDIRLLGWQGLISKSELATLEPAALEKLYNARWHELKNERAWPYPKLFPAAKSRLQDKKLSEPLDTDAINNWCTFTPALYLHVEFEVSKGTFIRALVDDLGKRLGTFACTLRLLRTKVGNFTLEEAHSEAEWQALFQQANSENCDLERLGMDLSSVFAHLPCYVCNEQEYRWLLQGRTLSFYPKKQAKKPEYSTEYFWKQLINKAPMSIIKQREFVLATFGEKVIALLSLQNEQILEAEQAELLDCSEQAVLNLVPERILYSHEDL